MHIILSHFYVGSMFWVRFLHTVRSCTAFPFMYLSLRSSIMLYTHSFTLVFSFFLCTYVPITPAHIFFISFHDMSRASQYSLLSFLRYIFHFSCSSYPFIHDLIQLCPTHPSQQFNLCYIQPLFFCLLYCSCFDNIGNYIITGITTVLYTFPFSFTPSPSSNISLSIPSKMQNEARLLLHLLAPNFQKCKNMSIIPMEK